VQGVLDEYAEHLPLTIRQVFYRLVGAHDYEKTERAYQRLAEHLNRARRARIIPIDVIRDDGGTISEPDHWDSAEQFMATIRAMAKSFTLDHSAGQATRLVVICEAGGMVPQLVRVAHPAASTPPPTGTTSPPRLPVTIARPRCCTSATMIRPAFRCSWPSSRTSRLSARLGGSARFTRLAVTPQQIGEYRLPTAPPKATDNRAFSGEICQAEALPPDLLANILRTAIEERVDQRVLARVPRQEQRIRRELIKRFEGNGGTP